MKKVMIALLSVAVVICVLIFGFQAYIQAKIVKHPFKQKNTQIEITVNKGDSVNKVINNLHSEGKLNSKDLLKFYIKVKNLSPKNIKPGTTTISSDITLSQFINVLEMDKKDKNLVKVTFPEGFNIEKMGEKLQEYGLISKDDFISACVKYTVPDYIKSDSNRRYQLEGFLFPNTYEFKKGISGEQIITEMLIRFEYIIEDIRVKQNTVINKADIDKTITMASIVEKEAQAKSERPIVASVFNNRLKKSMKLESCATVNYAMDKDTVILSTKDTQFKSPYNTYLSKGLPVGPICCPGRAAIEAALNPANTDYLYFVANMVQNDGTMVFAKTLDEHNENVRKYEKK